MSVQAARNSSWANTAMSQYLVQPCRVGSRQLTPLEVARTSPAMVASPSYFSRPQLPGDVVRELRKPPTRPGTAIPPSLQPGPGRIQGFLHLRT